MLRRFPGGPSLTSIESETGGGDGRGVCEMIRTRSGLVRTRRTGSTHSHAERPALEVSTRNKIARGLGNIKKSGQPLTTEISRLPSQLLQSANREGWGAGLPAVGPWGQTALRLSPGESADAARSLKVADQGISLGGWTVVAACVIADSTMSSASGKSDQGVVDELTSPSGTLEVPLSQARHDRREHEGRGWPSRGGK